MNQADSVSLFIYATLGIPQLIFAIRIDMSMTAKFGNGTIDISLNNDLRVMFCIFVARMSLNVHEFFLGTIPCATKTSLLVATINYDNSDFSEHQCICQTCLRAIQAA